MNDCHGTSCGIRSRESPSDVDNDQAAWVNLRHCLVPSRCAVSRTIWDCCWAWRISSPPRAADLATLLRGKAAVKVKEQIYLEPAMLKWYLDNYVTVTFQACVFHFLKKQSDKSQVFGHAVCLTQKSPSRQLVVHYKVYSRYRGFTLECILFDWVFTIQSILLRIHVSTKIPWILDF